MNKNQLRKIAIIGATGFVGRALTSWLLRSNANIEIVLCSRKAANLDIDENHKTRLRTLNLDLNAYDSTKASDFSALNDCDAFFYLVHAMAESKDFESIELEQAESFVSLVGDLNLKPKVIYLGGLFTGDKQSEHSQSRNQVARVLETAPGKFIHVKASIIIGNGSHSYEMIKALVHRVPVVLSTSWTQALCQPIHVDDLVALLEYALTCPLQENSFEIEVGGKSVVSYEELVTVVAHSYGLQRFTLKSELLPKKLAAEGMRIILPEYEKVAASLLKSIEIDSVMSDKCCIDHETKDLKSAIEIEIKRQTNGEHAIKELSWGEIFEKLQKNSDLKRLLYSGDYIFSGIVALPLNIQSVANLSEIIQGKIKASPLSFLSRYLKFSDLDHGDFEQNIKLPLLGDISLFIGKSDDVKNSYRYLFRFSPSSVFGHQSILAVTNGLKWMEQLLLSLK